MPSDEAKPKFDGATLNPPRLWQDAGWPDPSSEEPEHLLFYRNMHREANPQAWDRNGESHFRARYEAALRRKGLPLDVPRPWEVARPPLAPNEWDRGTSTDEEVAAALDPARNRWPGESIGMPEPGTPESEALHRKVLEDQQASRPPRAAPPAPKAPPRPFDPGPAPRRRR